MAILLHLSNIVLFLSLFDYSSQEENTFRDVERQVLDDSNNINITREDDHYYHEDDGYYDESSLEQTPTNNTAEDEFNGVEGQVLDDSNNTNITEEDDENSLEQIARNVGCFVDWNEFPSNDAEFWNRTILTLENIGTAGMTNLNVQCRKGSYFKIIGGGFLYENKNYLDSNTFNCVNGALQDLRERRFSRQNIECHEKLLCGGQNLTVRFIFL